MLHDAAPKAPAFEGRRILAILLPRLLTEMVQGPRLSLDQKQPRPLGVVLLETVTGSSEARSLKPTDRLSAVCLQAEKAGVRAGQTPTEACALLARLRVETIEKREVEERLIAIAEVASRYGTTVSWICPDTVWLDITGVAHLFGGEQALADELHEQVRLLGHVVRVVVASGPQIAQAVARWGGKTKSAIVKNAAHEMSDLPLSALPLDAEKIAWLGRLGLFTVGQVNDLPAKTASARLGDRALQVLELAQGIDRKPLVPGLFPQFLSEELEWDEPAEGTSPLLFALRGLVAKISARLHGRGEAASLLEVELEHDRAIARHRGVLSQTVISFELASPLYRESDLERVIKSRIERLELSAPTVGLRLQVRSLSPQVMSQVGLSAPGAGAWSRGGAHHQELPVLLAEISADVGAEQVGVLTVARSHRPEKRSVLEPLVPTKKRSRQKKLSSGTQTTCPAMDRITRILPHPQPIRAALRIGESFGLGTELYTIEELRFLQRLDGVEWWTAQAASRDYLWAWLSSLRGGTEALLYLDRHSKCVYLQALGD